MITSINRHTYWKISNDQESYQWEQAIQKKCAEVFGKHVPNEKFVFSSREAAEEFAIGILEEYVNTSDPNVNIPTEIKQRAMAELGLPPWRTDVQSVVRTVGDPVYGGDQHTVTVTRMCEVQFTHTVTSTKSVEVDGEIFTRQVSTKMSSSWYPVKPAVDALGIIGVPFIIVG